MKLPLTWDGLRAARAFADKGIQTNVTLCFSAAQALLAAKAGATFVSPFVGRLEDHGADGIGLLEEIRTLYDIHGFETQILAASLRNPVHVSDRRRRRGRRRHASRPTPSRPWSSTR